MDMCPALTAYKPIYLILMPLGSGSFISMPLYIIIGYNFASKNGKEPQG
jgi:hypothetical protein